MKSIFKKLIWFHVIAGILFLTVNFSLFHISPSIILSNFSILFCIFTVEYIYFQKIIKKMEQQSIENKDKREAEYQQAIKNIYDEHIFAITHELRSPLSVIAGSALNELNNLRSIYKKINNKDDIIKQNISNIKKSIKTSQEQVEIIESFISAISEHGSYVSEKSCGEKILNIQQYLISVLLNSHSFSRNMRIFKNNIMFGDGFGRDFDSVGIVVNPHDLSRIIMNLMTNAADAVSSSYKIKKQENDLYEPSLKIRCIKCCCKTKSLFLNDTYMKIIDSGPCPLYLVIEDNGPGITEENLTKIFQYGFSTKADQPKIHFGLGLHLSFKLAQKNNLSILVKTNEHGTKFVIGFHDVQFSDLKSEEQTKCSTDSYELYNESVKKETDTY